MKKILLAGNEIAGHYTGLSKGFEALGIPHALGSVPNKFNYEGDYLKPWVLRLHSFLANKRATTLRKHIIRKIFFILAHELLSALIPFWVISRFDVVMFCFAKTYTDSPWELWLYKKFGVKIVVTFHGSDARPQYISGHNFPIGEPVNWELMKSQVEETYNKIKIIEKYADVITAYPAISHFFTKPFINFNLLGNPVIMPSNAPSRFREASTNENSTIILHAPSAPIPKGSNEIRKIIQDLKLAGLNIELKELVDVPNRLVHEALAQADIVVDSMWNDCPAGTFPAEGLHWHMPVVIGSYFAEAYPAYVSEHLLTPPYVFCPPSKVAENLERLIRDKSLRANLSDAAKKYVESDGSLKSIAEKYLQCINGNAPLEWYCNPLEVTYLFGYGAPKEYIKSLVRGYIERYGVSSLCLSHRPELEKAFVEFSEMEFNN